MVGSDPPDGQTTEGTTRDAAGSWLLSLGPGSVVAVACSSRSENPGKLVTSEPWGVGQRSGMSIDHAIEGTELNSRKR